MGRFTSFSRKPALRAIWFSFMRRASRDRFAAMLFFLRRAQYLSSFRSSGTNCSRTVAEPCKREQEIRTVERRNRTFATHVRRKPRVIKTSQRGQTKERKFRRKILFNLQLHSVRCKMKQILHLLINQLHELSFPFCSV